MGCGIALPSQAPPRVPVGADILHYMIKWFQTSGEERRLIERSAYKLGLKDALDDP